MRPIVLVRREDRLGRPVHTETYGPGEALPEWAEEALAGRETQVSDPREEVKHCGGPWYKLPTGEKVRGKEKVKSRGFKPPS